MQCDDPPFLSLGTEVSAKFKGAYCEAKIKKVDRILKVKVALKESPFGSMVVPDTDLPNARFELNELTDLLFQRKYIRCQIQTIKDQSKYHVVFNDGDEKELRRTQLVLKGGKHFDADGNLDSMPLTNPESFSTPVIRGAAKRGAQKIRKSIAEASTSKASRGIEYDDDDMLEQDEDVVEDDEEKPRGRERRRAATNAMSTIVEHLDTASEDSADERRPQESASTAGAAIGTSEDEVYEDVDEGIKQEEDEERDEDSEAPGPSEAPLNLVNGSTLNDVQDSKLTKKLQKRLEKQAEKEERKRQKEEEREERQRQKEEQREKKREEKARIAELKRMEKLYRSAVERVLENHEKSMSWILSHKSSRYTSTLSYERRKKRGKKLLLHRQRCRIRNVKLYMKWRDLSDRTQMTYSARFQRQWWRIAEERVQSTVRAYKLMRNEERVKVVRKWLKGMENKKHVQFVVVHENYLQARRLLKFVEKNSEKKSFAERCELASEDVESSTLSKHFHLQEWYPAVLFEEVSFDDNGCRQRIVRHMGNGEMRRVWEDDLIPFHWLPEYEWTQVNEMVEQREPEQRKLFKLAWRFATDYIQHRLDLPTLRWLLGWRNKKRTTPQQIYLNAAAVVPLTVPSPTKRNEVHDDDPLEASDPSESDYDSDVSIKNAPREEKDMFIGTLLQFHDTHNSVLDTNPMIQGIEVDLYYLHELAKKRGGVKKVYALNLWPEFCRKLVPGAVNSEEELKTIFKNNLEAYLAITSKLNWHLEKMQPRTERKVVLPGQYSESRKKRAQALAQSAPQNQNQNHLMTPTTVPKRGRGGARVGGGRKRKVSLESGQERKRGRKSSSRGTTSSPGPTDHHSVKEEPGASNDIMMDHDQKRIDDGYNLDSIDDDVEMTTSAAAARVRKSRTPGRRSLSLRRDEAGVVISAPPKKGRPRKHPLEPSTSSSSSQHRVDGRGRRQKHDDGLIFVQANVLSRVYTSQKLQAFYKKEWFPATAITDSGDYTEKLLQVMLDLQKLGPEQIKKLSPEAEAAVIDILEKMRAKAHYTGWNQRYDEHMTFDKLMVTVDDQAAALKRFEKLPRGNEISDDTLALFEKYRLPSVTDKQQDLSKRARREEQSEGDVDESELDVRETSVDSEGYVGSDSDGEMVEETKEEEEVFEDEKFEKPETVSEETNGRKSDSEGDDDDEENIDEQEMKSEEVFSEVKSPEGTRSMTPASESEPLRSESPDEEPEDMLSRRSASQESPEEEESMTSLEPKTEEESPKPLEEKDLESESDEPEYPPAPTSPELEAMRPPPPTLQTNIPSMDRLSSGGSTYPTLSRQGSINSSIAMPPIFSPTNALAHSGPLTLEEVPPPTASLKSSALLEKEDDIEGTSSSDDFRKRCKSSEFADIQEPKNKRMRRASERSTGGGGYDQEASPIIRSPKRHHLLTSQFSSGALTLDITPQPAECSGPIEPLSMKKVVGRRKTASPTLISSGPLTLSPPIAVASVPKGRPPGASPLGRPKKVATAPPAVIRKPEETDDVAAENVNNLAATPSETVSMGEPSIESSGKEDGTSEGSTTPTEDAESAVEPVESPVVTTPKGLPTPRGGKRKRGGRFGGSYSTRTVKTGAGGRKIQDGEEKDEKETVDDVAAATPPITTPTHSTRADSFQSQKNRMAKLMEQEGTKFHFHLLPYPDFEKILAEAPKEDENMLLEEKTYELREAFWQCKSELSALEKRYRQQNEAKRKAEAAVSRSSQSSTSTTSTSVKNDP